jgi:hypothetical protein
MNEMILAERILRFTLAERKACNKAIKALLSVGYEYQTALLLVLDGPRFQVRRSENSFVASR